MWVIFYLDGGIIDRKLNPTIQEMASLTKGDIEFEYQPCVGSKYFKG